MSTTPWALRRADAADAAAITECAVEAFRHYIPRLGLTPIPMTKDYGAAIANAQVWVAQQEKRIVAALVLDITEEGFLIDVIAVRPAQQGTGVATRCSNWRNRRRCGRAMTPSISSPTRR